MLQRTPSIADRLFTAGERAYAATRKDPTERLAARFAAKEALAKALGAPAGLQWLDAEVHTQDDGRPRLQLSGSVAAQAATVGATTVHVSLSHDAGIASAVVVAEG